MSDGEAYSKICEESQSGAYVSYLRGIRCKTEDDFLIEVSASFQFPWYFGENWAAFDECICDLEWLKFKRIFVIFDDFSKMFKGDIELQKLLIKYPKRMFIIFHHTPLVAPRDDYKLSMLNTEKYNELITQVIFSFYFSFLYDYNS